MMAYRLIETPVRAVEAPLWRVMLSADRPMSASELHRATAAHPNAIQARLRRWELAGFVARHGVAPARFALTDAARAANDDQQGPPQVMRDGTVRARRRTDRARLWSAMRVLKQFTLPELLIASGATRRSAEDLINCLCRAGYLRVEHRGNQTKGEWSSYRLTRVVGPRAPSIRQRVEGGVRHRLLVDPNTNAEIDISPGVASLRRQPPRAGGRVNHDR